MRLGIDARSLLEPYPSGVSLYTTELIQALLALPDFTDTICLFTSGWNVPVGRLQPLLKHPRVEWQHRRVPNKLVALHLIKPIDQVLQSIDVLFVPNWNFLPVRKNCPIVLTVHDCSVQLYSQLLSPKQLWWHRLIRPATQLRRARHIISVSETTSRDCLQYYGVEQNRLTTIYSGAPTPVAPIPVASLPERYMVAIGTGGGRKNIDLVKQSHLPLPVVMIGEDGYLSPGEKWHVLQHASALLYVSLYEGFGFPPLEAWQAGVPVIASAVGAIPEICGPAALYINPYSSTDLVTAVTTVLTDTALRQQLITSGQERVKQFQWEKTARATLQVLHQSTY